MGRSSSVSALLTGRTMERQRAVVYCRALTQNLPWYPLLCPAAHSKTQEAKPQEEEEEEEIALMLRTCMVASTNLERTYTFI
jgi:hypothetical protein